MHEGVWNGCGKGSLWLISLGAVIVLNWSFSLHYEFLCKLKVCPKMLDCILRECACSSYKFTYLKTGKKFKLSNSFCFTNFLWLWKIYFINLNPSKGSFSEVIVIKTQLKEIKVISFNKEKHVKVSITTLECS